MQVKSKIYYRLSDGECVFTVGEYIIDMPIDTADKQSDFEKYSQLQNYNINDIDYIELEFGTFATTFDNVKSYKVNVETKQLEVVRYTQEELLNMENQKKEQQLLNDRITSIKDYLQINYDEQTLIQMEDLIIQQEFNKLNL